MPKDFDECARNPKSRIRTISGPSKEHGLKADEYVKYCFVNGKSFRGHVEKKKEKK